MTPRRVVVVLLLASGLAAAAGAVAWFTREPPPEPVSTGARLPTRNYPGGAPIRAEEITEGRLSSERLPVELNATLESHTAELVRTAQVLEQKQARITGTCAPGSAIRVIGEDGSVSCQKLPRGVVSVSALVGVPRLSGTGTAQGSVRGGVGRFQTSGEDDFLVAPVALPDGAEVTSFRYVFYDADPRVDGAAYLYRSDDQPMSALATSGASDQVRVATTEEVKLRRVDAGRYAYFVYFQTSAEAGANLVPISASVTYRLP